jgi:hypothetical protein
MEKPADFCKSSFNGMVMGLKKKDCKEVKELSTNNPSKIVKENKSQDSS